MRILRRKINEEERLYFMNLFACDFQLISFDVSPRSNRVFHSRASSSAELFASTCLFFTSREMKVDGGNERMCNNKTFNRYSASPISSIRLVSISFDVNVLFET